MLRAHRRVHGGRGEEPGPAGPPTVDLFLFHHDQDPTAPGSGNSFHNAAHVAVAAASAAKARGAHVRIVCCADETPPELARAERGGVEVVAIAPASLSTGNWDKLRLGAKVALLAGQTRAQLSAFLTQFDFPHYDYCIKAVDWLAQNPDANRNAVHVGGFYVSDLSSKAPKVTADVLRNTMPDAMYRWSQNSFAEHQFATLFFGKDALSLLTSDATPLFDAILPVATIAHATANGVKVERSRHVLVRVQNVSFLRHFGAWQRAVAAGFWPQHYAMVTNYNHELNALYDIVHGSAEAARIADAVSGHSIQAITAVPDADTRLVAKYIRRVQSAGRWIKNVKRKLGLKKQR